MSKQWVNRVLHRNGQANRSRQKQKRHRRLMLQNLVARQLLAGDVIPLDPTFGAHPAEQHALTHPAMSDAMMSPASDHAGQHTAHSAAMNLVSADQATHRAVASGVWSNPDVWENGVLPTEGARILIPQGQTVTVDSVLPFEYKTIGIHGTLRFATDVNTELRVDTIVSAPQGRFEMGTAANPVANDVTARVVFADDGRIDTTWDPEQLSRGAVLHGSTEIHGAAKTHRTTLASFPAAGATSLELNSVPENWKPGDQIVITGTQGSTSDEVRTIESIDGATVRFNDPLQQDHIPPQSDLNVYVANTTRNVQWSSENTDTAHRGHVMLMHTLDVNINHAEFNELGRTDKNRELDDLLFSFDDEAVGNFTSAPTVYSVTTGERTNVRGRYPVHFHRGGVDPNSTPATISGSVVDGSPGWGIVNHSSNVNFTNNVTYGVQGAAFYTEVGDEIGAMEGNIAIRTVSPTFRLGDEGAIDPDLRLEQMDFGVDGDGYWLSGHMVSMRNNVSAGASGHGFIIWSDGVIEPDLARGRSSVKVANVENGHLITGRDTIPTWWAPLAEVRDNESYGATIGFRSRYVHSQGYLGEIGSDFHTPPDQAYIDTLNPTIDGLTVWGSRDGVLLNYNERMSIRNARLIGVGAPYVQNGGTADTGVGIDMYNEVTRGPGVIENVSIEGFNMGLLAPRQDNWKLNNLELRNTTDMFITEMIEGPRVLEMTNVNFGSLDGTAVADQSANRTNIRMRADFEANPVHPFNFLMSDRVTLDGQQLYFNEQAADFVPTAGEIAESPGPVPASMIGLTNQQLVDRFGTSFGGAIIPEDATTADFLVGGVVGGLAPPPATSPPIYHPASESAGPNGLIIDPGTLTNFDGPVIVDDEDEVDDEDANDEGDDEGEVDGDEGEDGDEDGEDGDEDGEDDEGDGDEDGEGDDEDGSDEGEDEGDSCDSDEDEDEDDSEEGDGEDDSDDDSEGDSSDEEDSDDDSEDEDIDDEDSDEGDNEDESDDDSEDDNSDEEDSDDESDTDVDDEDDEDMEDGDSEEGGDEDEPDDDSEGDNSDEEDSDDESDDDVDDEDDEDMDDGDPDEGDDEDDMDGDSEEEGDDSDCNLDDEEDDETDGEDDDSEDDGESGGDESEDDDETEDEEDGNSDDDDPDSDDDDSDDGGDDDEDGEVDDEDDSDEGEGADDDDADSDDLDDEGDNGLDDDESDEDETEDDASDDDDSSSLDASNAFQNESNPTDVNADGLTTSLDALVVINFLSRHGSQFLQTLSMALQHYIDVNGDDAATALDALNIINAIADRPMENARETNVDEAITVMDLDDRDDEEEQLLGLLSEDIA